MLFETPLSAFNKAVGRLNAKNLYDLWTSSCILSCIEYFDNWEYGLNFLFPMLNPEKLNLLHRAILESRSAEYKQKVLDPHDVPYVFNALNDATNQRTIFLEGPDDPSARIRRMLSTMAHQQIRLQESFFLDRIGRTYMMLYEIPLTHQEELMVRMGKRFFNIHEASLENLGLSIIEFLAIGNALIALMMSRFKAQFTISEETREYAALKNQEGVRRRAEIITRIIEESRNIREHFTFRVEDLALSGSSILNADKISVFLTLLSRTTKELQVLMKQNPVYSEGFIPDKLNPLERYPIVRLDRNLYIVPNLRYFDTAATEVIHYILQETYPNNEYNQLRGYIQEIYLRTYLQSRLPALTILPETSYHKGKNRVEGPDLTVIDSESKTLIAIESKSKRVRVVSRVHPGGQYLLEDLQPALGAFEKLPTKIQDLYVELPEYRAYQEKINITKYEQPIAVVVIGEGVYFMGELLNDYLRDNGEHFLNNYPFPYCLMRIEVFERAIEISAQNGIPLPDLLLKYWTGSKSTNISEASSESFKPHPLEMPTLTQEYADKFLSHLLSAINQEAAK